MDKIKELLKKHRETITYLFFGVCTTLINIVSYYVCAHIFSISTLLSTIIAWIIAVVFAYITNKLWVFESKSWEKSVFLKEFTSFFTCRILTGLLDVVIMVAFVDYLKINDMIMKIISNILVIVLNYIASKLIIFKNKD